MSKRIRLAVTGLGIICALGRDRHRFWANAVEGRGGIGPVDLFDTSGCKSEMAGQVCEQPDAEGTDLGHDRRASRTDRFCMTAAAEAVEQAGLADPSPSPTLERFGVSLGCTTAGMLEVEQWVRDGIERGFDRQRVSRLLRLPTSAPADAVARMLGAGGPRVSNMTACASSALSIGHAADLIRTGEAPGMIAGGGDALCLMTFAGFNALRLLDPRPCRPFNANRHGLSLGEGAGMLVIERWDHAVDRGAKPLVEFLDYGATCDAYHMTAPHPDGRGAAAAMKEALARSGLLPEQIGHINAHGTGTDLNDATEAGAIRVVFGSDGVKRTPVTASKSMFGHVLGGSGGLEAVVLALSLIHQTAPPTLGWESGGEGTPALDIVAGEARRLSCTYGMSNSFGFGGANCSLIFGTAP